MERMEGLLKNLRLSKAESAGLKIGNRLVAAEGGGAALAEPKALGKVLSEKEASAEGLKQALGSILCPLRVSDVKNRVRMSSSSPFCTLRGRRKLSTMSPGYSTMT